MEDKEGAKAEQTSSVVGILLLIFLVCGFSCPPPLDLASSVYCTFSQVARNLVSSRMHTSKSQTVIFKNEDKSRPTAKYIYTRANTKRIRTRNAHTKRMLVGPEQGPTNILFVCITCVSTNNLSCSKHKQLSFSFSVLHLCHSCLSPSLAPQSCVVTVLSRPPPHHSSPSRILRHHFSCLFEIVLGGRKKKCSTQVHRSTQRYQPCG